MWFAAVALNKGFAAVLLWCGAQLNIGLGLFNLLPGFPMDGGRIFRSLARFFTTRARATYVAMAVGRVFAVLLVVGPLLGVTHIWIIPIGGSFILRALIAWMIWTAGWNEYQCTTILYPSICRWTSRFLPCSSYCKQYCNEHWGTCVFFSFGFLRVYAEVWNCWVIWWFYS